MLKRPATCYWMWVRHQISAWLAVLCVLGGVGCAVGHSQRDRIAWEQSRLIDLTHSFGVDTIVWPTEQDFQLVIQQAGETPGGYYYASNRLEMAEHGGTHIDAPIHFSKGGQTLDQVPIEHLIGAAVRIDVTSQCARRSGLPRHDPRFQAMGDRAWANSEQINRTTRHGLCSILAV